MREADGEGERGLLIVGLRLGEQLFRCGSRRHGDDAAARRRDAPWTQASVTRKAYTYELPSLEFCKISLELR